MKSEALSESQALYSGMIAPDPQRHPIAASARLSSQYGFCSRVDFRGRAFHLDMDARFHHRAILRVPTNFRESRVTAFPVAAVYDRSILAGSLIASELFRSLDRAAGNTRARVAGGIGFQVVFLFVNHDRLADDRIRPAQAQFAFPIEMRFAGSVGLNIAEVARVMLGRHSGRRDVDSSD